MLWEEKMERLEKYMDKQMDKQTKNKMSRNEHIEVLRTMAIGRTEKETIEYAIKQIKQAKKWKRKYLELREYLDVDSMITVYFDNEWAGMNVGEVADALNKLNIRKGGDA